MDYGWKVHHGLCSSDHFPILLELLPPLYDERLPHWKLNKTNWEIFETLCEQKLFQDPNTTNQTKYFMETLISIANKCIAKISTSNKHNTPWFNDDCRKAICLRKAALYKFNKQPTPTNLNSFKLLRAKIQKLIKEAKKKSWQNYVNQVGSSTKTNTIWRMIRKISRKPQPITLKHLTKTKQKQLQEKTAEVLAETFSENSSLKNSNSLLTKANQRNRLNFKTNNSEEYNLPFYTSRT